MYDFITAAFPWIAMGLFVAIACANGDKIKLLWAKWDNNESKHIFTVKWRIV